MSRRALGRLGAALAGLGLVLLVAGAVFGGAGGPAGWPFPASSAGSGAGWGPFGFMGPGMLGGGGMMGGNGDAMGQMMGRALAGRVGQPIPQAEATALGDATPAGASVDRTAKRITFRTSDVRFAVLASPPGGPDETFRIAGLVNPTIVVPQGATVTVQLINADPDMSHNWAVVDAQAPFPYMTMMTRAAFAGASSPPLGDPTSAGLPSVTFSFTASTAGTYTYLCQVPGHAAQGMYGTFEVVGA